MHGSKYFPDGSHKGTDHRHQSCVQKCPGTSSDRIEIGKESIAQNDGHILKLRIFPDELLYFQLIGPAVIGCVELHDTDTVAILEKVRKLFPECLPVRLFGSSRIRQDMAVHQQNVVE